MICFRIIVTDVPFNKRYFVKVSQVSRVSKVGKVSNVIKVSKVT